MVIDRDIAVSVKHVSKVYKLYSKPIDRLKESLGIFKRSLHKEFYALKEISFEIRKGESIAIVGKNGSGKSTLLKMITGVLQPTSGEITVNGKIAALLELGAGFNPEYTGIQNIYLNGTMMGYSKEEIQRKIPSILEFADIGDFVHHPVKTYSSGMYVRLAFSVAINVDPDILIVDEALAVGDDLFQRKCFAKIEEFRSRNKTIVFVTHSSSTVVELCNRAILLDSGEQLIVDKSQRVVNLYHKLLFASEEKRDKIKEQIVVYTKKEEGVGSDSDLESVDPKSGVSDEEALFQRDFFDESLVPKDSLSYELVGARIFDYVLVNSDGEKVNVIQFGHKYLWRYKVEFLEHCANARFGMMIKTNKGLELCGAATHKIGAGIKDVVRGEILQVEFSFMPRFVGGVYYLSCGVLGNTNGEEVFMHRFVEVWPFRLQDQSNSLLSGIVDMNLKSIIKKIKEAE